MFRVDHPGGWSTSVSGCLLERVEGGYGLGRKFEGGGLEVFAEVLEGGGSGDEEDVG